ncbi:RIO1-domain-containing protein [Wolfiporia cocos MD-104 SS10]|uniref:Serine/threonine-protein kinase RIO1 n=1 Tax=Wolfiporia cocos (strain MD-104) TaxID=742152 RepID=A0A2H3JCX8_WOLCO|nr:RIO1-domain-containing protein [Wolfiporia cocos MD-104 SS10]
MSAADQVEEGQFDDAPGDLSAPAPVPSDPRAGHAFIDDAASIAPDAVPDIYLEWSSDSELDSEDEHEREHAAEEDALEAAAFQTLRAEDEDWEIAERDFTKQYNRLRQHVAVRTGTAAAPPTAASASSARVPLPAVNRPRPGKAKTASKDGKEEHAREKTADQLQALARYAARIRDIDMPYGLSVGVNRKGPSATANMKDKRDRATSEQVLDPRTRIILFKMIGRGLIFEVNGCVSTGKEANVYHAFTPARTHMALKIYKTSILVFKDRDKYVTGEFRFRRGYSRHNPRKMVRLWAEKELRNLKRLHTTGIRCPEPVEVRENVLAMGFVGDRTGNASPRLKDAQLTEPELPELYVELLCIVRRMYNECRLVHADLSEYNILYHVEEAESTETHDAPPTEQPSSQATEPPVAQPSPSQPSDAHPPEHPPDTEQARRGHLYIIDVSQSVEHDHPHAYDFLRADLRNVDEFFAKRGVHVLGLRRAFEFVTRERLELPPSSPRSSPAPSSSPLEADTAVLRHWLSEAQPDAEPEDSAAAPSGPATAPVPRNPSTTEHEHEDAVFMRSYIPRTLNEVYDPERDVDVLAEGDGARLIYRNTIGIVGPREHENGAEGKKGVRFANDVDGQEDELEEAAVGVAREEDEESQEEDEESEEGGDGTSEDDEYEARPPRGHRHEDKEVKKERKKAAKEAAREKRKHKIPKAEKKRKIKATARGS